MANYRLILANALKIPLPNKSVHCSIWSPPYWKLRDYEGHRDQIGQEATPEEYAANIVKTCKEIWRVLRDDGTLWINIGDTWVDKVQVGVPWMTAFALGRWGWVRRQEIIWSKPNAMPESATDRVSDAHEQIFLFTKSKDYFFDHIAIQERIAATTAFHGNYANKGQSGRRHDGRSDPTIIEFRNKRSVWTVPVGALSDAHFAAYPPRLIQPCVLAGTSEKGCCSKCGAPWRRVVNKQRYATRPGVNSKIQSAKNRARLDSSLNSKRSTLAGFVGNRDPFRHVSVVDTLGWEPTCHCGCKDTVPCTILDPFNGAGTTGLVALHYGRNYVGLDINEKYLDLTVRRFRRKLGLFATGTCNVNNPT